MGASNSSELVDAQITNREIEILKNLKECPVELKAELQKHDQNTLLTSINEYSLKDSLDDRFYDYRLMKTISCIYGNSWFMDRKLFKVTDLTKSYFKPIKNLSNGAEGVVYRADKGGSNMTFIIKAISSRHARTVAIHELFIGLTITNPLRARCPNFAYVYGGFMCGMIDNMNMKLCAGNIDIPYIVYEDVEGLSLYKFMLDSKGKDTEELYSVIIQCWLALQVAREHGNEFSHGDSHTQNIILRPLKKMMSIKYVVSGKTYYVNSKYVATFIDYGLSQAWIWDKTEQKYVRFGRVPRTKYMHIRNMTRLADFAKLLGWTLLTLLQTEITRTPLGKEIRNENITNVRRNLMRIYLNFVYPDIMKWPEPNQIKYISNLKKQWFDIDDYHQLILDRKEIDLDDLIDKGFKSYIPNIELYLTENKPIYDVLECRENCLDYCSTFKNLLTSDPKSEAKQAIENGKLLEHVSDDIKSYFRFKNTNPEKYKEYVQSLRLKLIENNKFLDQNNVNKANLTIKQNIDHIKTWLSKNTPFIPLNSRTIGYFSNILTEWAYILLFMRESILLNNTLVDTRRKTEHKQELLDVSNLLVETYKSFDVVLKNANNMVYSKNEVDDKLAETIILTVINRISNVLNLDPIK